jgi:Tfp pilus assembly protein PilO
MEEIMKILSGFRIVMDDGTYVYINSLKAKLILVIFTLVLLTSMAFGTVYYVKYSTYSATINNYGEKLQITEKQLKKEKKINQSNEAELQSLKNSVVEAEQLIKTLKEGE